MKYYIKAVGEEKFIYTEIDPGGMSAWLVSNKEIADTWKTRESAESFIRRLAEPASKFRDDKFEIVV